MISTRKKTLGDRIQYRIKRSATPVFMPTDFKDLSDSDQIGRVLRNMTRSGSLIKIGQGVYTRSKISKFNSQPTIEKPIQELAKYALAKRRIRIVPSTYEKRYNLGQSTQVPTGRRIGVIGRVSLKLGYRNQQITYEKISKR